MFVFVIDPARPVNGLSPDARRVLMLVNQCRMSRPIQDTRAGCIQVTEQRDGTVKFVAMKTVGANEFDYPRLGLSFGQVLSLLQELATAGMARAPSWTAVNNSMCAVAALNEMRRRGLLNKQHMDVIQQAYAPRDEFFMRAAA